MIDKNIYGIDYIRDLQTRYLIDPGLLERTVYAFGLLEAITAAGLPFCFKGGTSLMLILDKPIRLSTDIDIMVNPGTKVDSYIEKASKIFPFINMEENIRRGSNDIEKRHFKFTYLSPIQKRNFYILLDIVFAQSPYVKTVHKEIKNDLLLTTGENLTVEIPTPECILADKLTAFAPHTTGVLLGEKKELEIAKQLFDITNLIDHITDYQTVLDTYCKTVADETRFRGENGLPKMYLKILLKRV